MVEEAKSLYIFVTSDIPDVYINVIGYCLEHYKISKINYLGIVKDRGQKLTMDQKLEEIKKNVSEQLALLQEGKYKYKNKDVRQWNTKSIDIKNHEKQRYNKIATQRIEFCTLVYDDIDNEINTFLRLNNNQCIFDVSAISKSYLVDVYNLLLSKGITEVYTFELKFKTRSYDEKELIHNLSQDTGDYDYYCLAKSNYTNGKIIVVKEEYTRKEKEINTFNTVLQVLAKDFATKVFIFYIALILIFIIACAFVVIKFDWNISEKWFFLIFLPLSPYLAACVWYLVSKQELSINPKDLFSYLENYKLLGIRKRFGLERNERRLPETAILPNEDNTSIT